MADISSQPEYGSAQLRHVIEVGQLGVWELDLETGHAWRNLRHDEIFGYPDGLDEWTYEQFLDHVIEQDRERVDSLQSDAVANARDWIFECRIKRADDQIRWISAAGRPLRSEDGKPAKLIGHVIDISDTKAREDRLELLTQELNHRVRNMLAMVKSMVRLSASHAGSVEAFAGSLEGRVGALVRTQELLVGDDRGAMEASAILEREIAAFSGLDERIDIVRKNDVVLEGAVAQGLALVLHELLTNAIKYGALSNDTGRVRVSIDSDLIAWSESGGPPVSDSPGSGFGKRLIASALNSHGRVEWRAGEDGVECRIHLADGSRTGD